MWSCDGVLASRCVTCLAEIHLGPSVILLYRYCYLQADIETSLKSVLSCCNAENRFDKTNV